MLDRCKCGGRYIEDRNGLSYCEKCGEEQDRCDIELPYRNLSRDELGWYKNQKRNWSKDCLYRNKKILELMVKNILPIKISNNFIYLFRELFKINYEFKVPRTRDKRIILWAVFMGLLRYNIDLLGKEAKTEEDKKLLKNLEMILRKLKEENSARFKKAERIFRETKSNIFLDVIEVDSCARYATNNKIFDLFYKNLPKISNAKKIENIKEIVKAGKFVANVFLYKQINKQVAEKEKKIRALKKRNGLLCVACYFVCINNNLEVKEQKEWCNFFHISESCFDKQYKELRSS